MFGRLNKNKGLAPRTGYGRLAAGVLLIACAMASAAHAGAEPFPRPASLEPAVAFWTRVYTEIDTSSGFIHDARRLDVVYATVELPAGISRKARSRRIEKSKTQFVKILRKLASGRRSGLSDEETRVLAAWPDDVTNDELRAGAGRLRFQLGQSDRFRAGIVRSGAWLPYITKVFADRGLPPELAYLPHVESSFHPGAASHAAAVGLWQFTRSTGRLYMEVDHVVDERRDPFIATVAAARLLEDNHEVVDSWPLALTGYNHGIAGMRRAARKLGTKDIGVIVERYKSRSFGFASRNFYASFLAVIDIERDVQRYFGDVRRDPPLNPDVVTMDAFVSADTASRYLEVPLAALRAANPALSTLVWSGDKYIPKGYPLRVPGGRTTDNATALLAAVPAALRSPRQTPDQEHRVAAGETLSQIASRYGVRTSAIVRANGLRSAHRIRAGQVLKLPQSADAPRSAALAATTSRPSAVPVAAASPDAGGVYRVRNGDTLSAIASRFQVTERALANANGLHNKHRIYIGQTLAVPGAAGVLAAGVVPDTYKVRRGDTLSRVARRFQLSESRLAQLNGLHNKHRIYVGQTLRLTPSPATTTGAGPESSPLKLAKSLTAP